MKSKRTYISLVAIVAAIGFLVVKGLGSATEYFRTTEEAVAQQDTLGSKRFRLEGTVSEDSLCAPSAGGVRFVVENNAKRIAVHHDGDPPELFRANIPVVLSGAFDAKQTRPSGVDAPVFASDLVMIKHSNEYIQKNKTRVTDYVGKGSDKTVVTDAVATSNIPTCT
jgi:cytochrome c-type biogenesis protein CcmE